MPTYFFHLIAPGLSLPDDEGTVLTDLTAARKIAESTARNIIDDLSKEGLDLSKFVFNVTDDHGEQVLVFEFKTLLNGDAH